MGRNRKRSGAGAVTNTVGVTINGVTPAAYIDNINNGIARFVLMNPTTDEFRRARDEANKAVEQLPREISNMSKAQQQALADSPNLNGDVMVALSLYAAPDIREQIAQKALDAFNTDKYDLIVPTFGGDEISWSRLYFRGLATANKVVNVSLDADLLRAEQQGENPVEKLFRIHALHSEHNPNWSAQWQNTMTYVGPNADVPRNRVPTFFPLGVTPPAPNPRLVKLLNDEYNRVQAELARRGITEVKLYRETPLYRGVPLEPWTPSKSVAAFFGRAYRQRIRRGEVFKYVETIPAKYFIGRWDITPGWPEREVMGKKEHMVAGLAYAYDQNKLEDFSRF